MFFFSPRRSGGGGVPRGREGHGTAGGSGVRRGPDHPLYRHILLAHPGHSVKQTLPTGCGTDAETREKQSSRSETFRCSSWIGFLRERRQKCSGPLMLDAGERGRERPPVSLLCYCHNHTAIQRELNAGRLSSCQESSTRRRRRPSSASGLESHVSGVSRVTSLLCANSLLWDIQMPLWPLTLEGFLLHLLGEKKKTKKNLF